MREHLAKGILLHYVISNGGQRPNIVPEKAATFLYVRAPVAETVRGVMKRIMKADRRASLDMINAPVELLKSPLHGEVGDFGRGMRSGGSIDTAMFPT
ncbi:MAG TPA: hypothetical protein VN437_05000 [Rectinemataceae bacterium]|nr:hypothetical protein [Rectinemataceae bacterium]